MEEELLEQLLDWVRGRYFGKYRGTVEDNADETQRGRLRVKVPAVLGDLKVWAMPCVPYAGDGVGFYSLPEQGTGVWVEFEAGDPSYLIWTGFFWGDGELPDQPDANIKVWKTEQLTLRLDDEAKELLAESASGAKLTLTEEAKAVDGASEVRVDGLNWVPPADPQVLQLRVRFPDGFSPHIVHIDDERIDPYCNSVRFSFQASCPSDLDCEPPAHQCPPDESVQVDIDYRARDFWSLRQALLDFASLNYPHWTDRLEADAGVMLVEVMSALGDELAYYQDRIGREAYLETATQRRSLRRHARLVDYEIYDGLAASTWLDVTVKNGESGDLEAGIDIWAESDDGQRRARVDIIGPYGSPNGGFCINNPTVDEEGNIDFEIAAGTFYLGGLCLELLQAERPETFQEQKDWLGNPGISAPNQERYDLVYLEAWQQPVSAVEDEELLEMALSGPDTSIRLRTMYRVRFVLRVCVGFSAFAPPKSWV